MFVVTNYYRQGDGFEKRVLADLRIQDYLAWQSRGSKSPVDIIALRSGQVLLVQVKGGLAQIGHDGWNDLYDLAQRVAGVPILAQRSGRKIRYRQLTGLHLPRSRYWPSVSWPCLLSRGEPDGSDRVST